MEDYKFWCIGLSKVRGIGCIIGKHLIETFTSAEKIFSASEEELAGVVGKELAKRIKNFSGWDLVEKEIHTSEKIGSSCVCLEDKDYPPMLRNIADPPLYFYYLGNYVSDALCISIVGTRRPTPYGVEVAHRFSSTLSSAGICISSGFARGIDTVAHKAAVESNGVTWAILGSGIDKIYPPENLSLFKKILDKGLIISEFPAGTPPNAENFPRRNRIISGISRGVVVIEAPERSGALITAYLSMEQGREVFAVPGNITSEKSAGPHKLIKDGARLVGSPEEILSELLPSPPLFKMKSKIVPEDTDETTNSLTQEESKIYSALDSKTAVHIDDLIRKTGLDASKAISTILMLEMKGLVKEEGMGFYIKNRKR